MLINLSNHPLSTWSNKQKNAAIAQFGELVDYPFPHVSPDKDINEIKELAQSIFEEIINLHEDKEITIHIMGEFSLVYQLVCLFQLKKIPCVLSTSHRIVEEQTDGSKKVFFDFVKFRSYY